MSKKVASRKPEISNFILKHEEGHVAYHLDDNTGKYIIEMEEIDKILKKIFRGLDLDERDLTDHDKNREEFFADKYAKEHNRYKHRKNIINFEQTGCNINMNKGLLTLMSTDQKMRKEAMAEIKKEAKAMASMRIQSDFATRANFKIGFVKNKINDIKRSISFQIKFINDTEKSLQECKRDVDEYESLVEKKSEDIKKYNSQIESIVKACVNDLNNELIVARKNGKVLSKHERKEYSRLLMKKINNLTSKPEFHRNWSIKDMKTYQDLLTINRPFLKKLETDLAEQKQQLKNDERKLDNSLKELDRLTKFTNISTDDVSKTVKWKEEYDKVCRHLERMNRSDEANVDNSTLVRAIALLDKNEQDQLISKYKEFVDRENDDSESYVQEGYSREFRKQQRDVERANNMGELTNIKSIVRACTSRSGEVRMSKIDPELGRPYGDKYKKLDMVSYKKAFDYVKPIFDELVNGTYREIEKAKKKLFELCGIKDPEHHVFIVNSSYRNKQNENIHFTIIKANQNKYFVKTTNTRFFHFSKDSSMTTLIPKHESREFSGHIYIYPTDRCFFWAIENDDINKQFISYAMKTYGENIYEYIPKSSDKIYIDTAEPTTPGKAKAVFINTTSSLKVSKVTEELVAIADSNSAASSSVSQNKENDVDVQNFEVRSEYKRIETIVMNSLKQKQVMKQSTHDPKKYAMIEERLKSEIDNNIEYISDTANDTAKKYPEANNLSIFDDLKKSYEKKAKGLLQELQGLIRKSSNKNVSESFIQEAKLTTTKRDKLKDSEFGIPEKRTFPLNDKNHVEAAARMFPHADASDKEDLAKRILRKAHEFGMDTSGWDSINKYVVQEGMFANIELVEIPYVTASSGYKPTVADESQINPFALFDKIPINDYTVNRYKSRTDDMAIGLKHLHVNDNVRGFIWLNQQDEVVGYVAVEKQDIGPFIIALELSPKYQGKGLGKALLEFAENYLGGRYLSVSKKNTHAFEMYKKCGWVVYDETPHMYFMKKDDNIVQPVVQEGAWQDIKNGVNPKSKKLFFHVSMDTKMNGKTLKPRIPTYLTKKGSVSDTYKEDSTIPRVCFSPSIEGCLNAIISAQKNLHIVGEKMFVYIPEKPISEYKVKTNKEIIKEKLVFDANATGEIWILEPVKLKLYGVIMVDQVKNIRDKPTINGDPHCRCDYKWHWAVTPKYVDRTLEYQVTYDEDSSKKKKTTKE